MQFLANEGILYTKSNYQIETGMSAENQADKNAFFLDRKRLLTRAAKRKRDVMKKKKIQVSGKTIFLLILLIVVIIGITIAMLPLIRLLSTDEGQAVIVEKMQSFGIFAPLLFLLLQVIQVVIAVIPGGPVPIIGGVLFGKWGALALCLAGFFLGTVLVYYLVQWIGRPLVDKFVSEDHFEKFAFLQDSKRLEWIIFLVFFLPGLPKDALTYLVSFDSKIKPMRLFFLTTLGRTPATVLTVFVGDSLWKRDYKLTIILIAVMIMLGVAGFFVKKQVDRHAEKRRKKQKES